MCAPPPCISYCHFYKLYGDKQISQVHDKQSTVGRFLLMLLFITYEGCGTLTGREQLLKSANVWGVAAFDFFFLVI